MAAHLLCEPYHLSLGPENPHRAAKLATVVYTYVTSVHLQWKVEDRTWEALWECTGVS